MKKVALTGNIGCGKSYVIGQFKKFGLFVLDVDVIAKEVRNKHIDEISEMFQIDAKDTKKLATLIFNDEKKRITLENFLYPKIIKRLLEYFEIYKEEKMILVEVPLLYEKNWDIYFDEVIVVSSDEKTSFKRLQLYRNMDMEDIKNRVKNQMSLSEKEKRADYIIYNNEEDDVKKQIRVYLKREGIIC